MGDREEVPGAGKAPDGGLGVGSEDMLFQFRLDGARRKVISVRKRRSF